MANIPVIETRMPKLSLEWIEPPNLPHFILCFTVRLCYSLKPWRMHILLTMSLAHHAPHLRGEPGAKPFVDDLLLGQGFVRSRAAPSLRSIESQPLTQWFVYFIYILLKKKVKKKKTVDALVSLGSHNKVPCTCLLKLQVYFLTLLETRGQDQVPARSVLGEHSLLRW